MRLRISLPLAALFMAVVPACAFGQYYSQAYDSFERSYGGGYQFGYQSGWIDGSEEGRVNGAHIGTEEGYSFGYSSTYAPAFNLSFTAHFSVSGLDGFNATYPVEFRDAYLALQNRDSGSTGGTLINNFDGGGDHRSGWERGYESGFEVGHEEGFAAYFSITYEPAYVAAVEPGRVDGRTDGHAEGAAEGSAGGYNAGASLGRRRGAEDGRAYYYDDNGSLAAWQAEWDRSQTPYTSVEAPTPSPTDLLPPNSLPDGFAQSVPEPSGFCIILFGILGLLRTRACR